MYIELDSDESYRITDVNDYNWASGTRRPDGSANTVGFRFKSFKTIRRNVSFEIPWEVMDQADYDVLAHHAATNMTRMFTLLTKSIIDHLQDPAVWQDTTKNIDHSQTATFLGGGPWASATSSNEYIRRSLDSATEKILLDSGGTVDEDSLVLVISPQLARTIVATSEFQDYLKNNSFALVNKMGEQFVDHFHA
jgi:hypothetical protein